MDANRTPRQTQCRVCTSPDHADIDAALRSGMTPAAVARKAGLPYHNVVRHRARGHVIGAPRPPARRGPKDDSAAGVLREALDALRDMDPTQGMSQHAQIARIDAIRRGAEALTKIAPPPRARTMTYEEFEKVVVGENGATVGQLFGAWIRALEPFPEARAAMLEAYKQVLGVAPALRGPRATIREGKEATE